MKRNRMVWHLATGGILCASLLVGCGEKADPSSGDTRMEEQKEGTVHADLDQKGVQKEEGQEEEGKSQEEKKAEDKKEEHSKSEKAQGEHGQTTTSSSENLPQGGNESRAQNPGPGSGAGTPKESGGESSQTNQVKPSHSHTWVAQTKTVHHDAQYTSHWVEDSPAWEEPIYEEMPVYEMISTVKCSGCGKEFEEYKEWQAHCMEYDDQEDYSHGSYTTAWHQVQTGSQTVQTGSIPHEAVGHVEQVLIRTAWDETVTDGYRCSGCGAVK